MKRTYAALAEAFTIFQKYKPDYADTSAEHDVIYAGPHPDEVEAADLVRLEALGWHIDTHVESFYYYT